MRIFKGKLDVDILKKAVDLEITYAQDVLPRGILGLNSEMFVDYMQFVANRRLENMGMEFRYDSDHNPFPWLAEVIDTGAMTNFFERKVESQRSQKSPLAFVWGWESELGSSCTKNIQETHRF